MKDPIYVTLVLVLVLLQTVSTIIVPRGIRPMKLKDYSTCFQQFKESSQVPNPDIGLTIDDILVKYGYPVQILDAETKDGYVLKVYRIPYSPKSPLVPGERKKAVYLNHGLGSNGQSFLIQYKNRNLAMLLADSGFDVFLGNVRGSRYSQGHRNISLSINRRRYWDFSFHEIGVYDTIATIDLITSVTGNEKIYYVGHSMGTTSLVVALSECPEYNSKIATAFFLAAGLSLKHSTNPVRLFGAISKYSQYLFNFLFGGKFAQAQTLHRFTGRTLGNLCATPLRACGFCANYMFLSFGYDGGQMNYTTLGPLFDTFPDAASTKTFVHFTQLIRTEKFCQFDYAFRFLNERKYGTKSPPCYNLHNYMAPTVIYHGANDNLNVPRDVKNAAYSLGMGAVKEINLVEWPDFNHLDFVSAIDADTLVYHKIVDAMLNETYG